ncbi:MAG TPA: type II secretion system F family protein, partial [Chloroflexi bacterium]|nr:type II secretion system F family protein [Chloroflexota bacterium]
LPDALDLITISVEAGLGFDAALARVAEKWDNELSREFARALGEMRVGRPRHEALRDMAARAGIPEVANFVAAVIQADQLGVSIAKVMRVQSEQMRIRRRQKAEELAHKAPIKMIVPLVVLVFPSILIILLGPALISIKNSAIFKGLFG